MNDALTHLKAMIRATPAVSQPQSASQFMGASCRMMEAYDAARAFLATAPRPDSERIAELLVANSAYLQRARDAETHRDELKAALDAHEVITESCGICRHPFVEGVLTLHDISMGEVHAACCGPERDSYVNLETEEPIGPDEPIPTGTPWVPLAAMAEPAAALLRRLRRLEHSQDEGFDVTSGDDSLQRLKTTSAIRALKADRLLARTRDGWTATPEGVRVLTQLEARC